MSKHTYFGTALHRLLIERGMTQSELSRRSGIAQSTISRVISYNKLAADDVIRALCSCWPDRSDNLRLLMAGLRDMISNWGYDPEASIDLSVCGLDADKTSVDPEMEELRGLMADRHAAVILRELGAILKRGNGA